jgi:hypothetical protein
MITIGDIVRLKPSYKGIYLPGKFPVRSKGNLYKVVNTTTRKVLVVYSHGKPIRSSHQVLEIADKKGRKCRVPIEYVKLISANMGGMLALESDTEIGAWIRGTARSPRRKANIRDAHPLPWIVSSSDFVTKEAK